MRPCKQNVLNIHALFDTFLVSFKILVYVLATLAEMEAHVRMPSLDISAHVHQDLLAVIVKMVRNQHLYPLRKYQLTQVANKGQLAH